MNILDFYDIFSLINFYLSDEDTQSLAYTCSKYKKLNKYKVCIRLTRKTFSLKKLIRIEELSVSKPICLDLSHCQEITDVSMLKNLHALNLSYCQCKIDVSMLGELKKLNLRYCDNLYGKSKLSTVKTLIYPYTSYNEDQYVRFKRDVEKYPRIIRNCYKGTHWTIKRTFYGYLIGYIDHTINIKWMRNNLSYYSHNRITSFNPIEFDCCYPGDFFPGYFIDNNIYRSVDYVKGKIFAMIDYLKSIDSI